MGLLNKKPWILKKDRGAAFITDIVDDDIMLAVTYFNRKTNKDYKSCYGAWKPSEAIKIANSITNIANELINKGE